MATDTMLLCPFCARRIRPLRPVAGDTYTLAINEVAVCRCGAIFGEGDTLEVSRPAPLRLAVTARGTCPACGDIHHIQHCPQIAALRDAPDGADVRGLAACLEASHVN